MVAVLLTHGASKEEATPRGSTPLMLTVWENKLSTCKILLEKGANVHHARHSDGITPLMKAAENGNDEIVTLLIKFGARLEDAVEGSGRHFASASDLLALTAVFHSATSAFETLRALVRPPRPSTRWPASAPLIAPQISTFWDDKIIFKLLSTLRQHHHLNS